MASSRILMDPVRFHLSNRHFFRPQSRLFAFPRLCIPTRRAAISVTAMENLPTSTRQIPPLGHSSHSPRLIISPSVQSAFKSRLLHSGQTPSFWQQHPSILPWTVVVVCGVCFAYASWAQVQQINHGNGAHVEIIQRNFTSSLTNYHEGRWWTLLTPTIMHIQPFHIIANMLCLVSLGPSVVQLFGARAFMITWVGAGVFSSAANLIPATMKERKTAGHQKWGGSPGNNGTDSRKSSGGGVGASGSMFGLFALLTCYAPRMEMQIMPIPIPIPAWGLLLGSVGLSLAALEFGWLPSLGHEAHLGGMAFGVLYYALLRGRGGIPRFR